MNPIVLLAGGAAALLLLNQKKAAPATTVDQANFFGQIVNRTLASDYAARPDVRMFSQQEFNNMIFVLAQGDSATIAANGQALGQAGYPNTAAVFASRAQQVKASGR